MNRRIDLIQVYRGLAALMVVVHHIVPPLSFFQNIHFPIIDYFASLGKYGVDFFFVLSGFIIHYSNAHKSNNNIGNYIKNRLIRIYVPYIPIGITIYFLYYLLPSLSQSSREISTITSFTLFPDGEPALSVAWTLTFELFFYLLYTLCLYKKKMWDYFLSVWVLSILFLNMSGFSFSNPVLSLIFSYYNLEFVLGYTLSLVVLNNMLVERNVIKAVTVLLFGVFVLFTFKGYLPFPFFINSIFALASSLLIYYSIMYEDIKLNGKNIFMLIGNSSYSLYLIHGPINSFLGRFLPVSENWIIFVVYIIFILSVCVFFGYIYYYIFERKLLNVVKKII